MLRVKHIYSLRTIVLTWRVDPLHDFFRIVPKLEQNFRDNIRAASLENGIKNPEFRSKKERILILRYLLEDTSCLDGGQIRTLAEAILDRKDKQAVLALLKLTRSEDKGSTSDERGSTSDGFRVFNTVKDLSVYAKTKVTETTNAIGSLIRTGKNSNLTREEALWRDAHNYASSVSDSSFLQLITTPIDECLRDAIVDAEETAYTCLRKLIESLVDGIGPQFLTIQKAEDDKQIKRAITSEEEKELGILRSKFVHRVEDLSREHSRSYVHYNLRPQVARFITHRSPRSIYVDRFAKKESRYSQGCLLSHPV